MTELEAIDWCEQFRDNIIATGVEKEKYTLALKAMRTAITALNNQVSSSKWIPVSEPPKEPGIYQVFGYDKDWEKTKVWYGQFSGYDWFVYNIYGDGMRFYITHWMPLPEAPKGE